MSIPLVRERLRARYGQPSDAAILARCAAAIDDETRAILRRARRRPPPAPDTPNLGIHPRQIRELMEWRGWNDDDLAAALRERGGTVAARTVRHWLGGRHAPAPPTMALIRDLRREAMREREGAPIG